MERKHLSAGSLTRVTLWGQLRLTCPPYWIFLSE